MRMLFAGAILVLVGMVGQCLAQGRLPGDVDGDGDVDFADFVVISANFGRTDGEVFDPGNTVDTIVVIQVDTIVVTQKEYVGNTDTVFVSVVDTFFVDAPLKSLSKITVLEEGWTNVHRLFVPEFVRVLTHIARDILAEPLEFPLDSDIVVGWTPQDHAHIHVNRTRGERGQPGRHLIMLSVDPVEMPYGYPYTQVLFQFAHEYAHVLTNFYMVRGGANRWFEEAICDVASLYVIRELDRMIQNQEIEIMVREPGKIPWLLNANLRGYLTNVGEVAFDLQNSRMPLKDFQNWFSLNHGILRRNLTDSGALERHKIVVANFIDIFEEHPDAWNVIRYLGIPGPVSWSNNQRLGEYLRGWHQRTPSKWQHHVTRIENQLGIYGLTEVHLPASVETIK